LFMIKHAFFLEFFKKGHDFQKLLNSNKKDGTTVNPIEEKKQKITMIVMGTSTLLATLILLAVLPAATIPNAFADGGCGSGPGAVGGCGGDAGLNEELADLVGGFGAGTGSGEGGGSFFSGGGGSGSCTCGLGEGGGYGEGGSGFGGRP
jgi:hypothetical protein